MTHFLSPFAEGETLCGKRDAGGVWCSNPKADCVTCQNEWQRSTGWDFPLPDLVAAR